MDRRRFLLGSLAGVLAAPRAAEAQQAERVHRLGWLSDGSAALAAVAAARQLFLEGMRQRGYVQGKNLTIESRYAEGKGERLHQLAAQLVGLKVDLIVANGPAVLRAAKAVTATVPIVAIDFETDAVAERFIETLARPGGNITGIFLDQPELSGKWIEMLKNVVPTLSRVAALRDTTSPRDQLNVLEKAAGTLALRVDAFEVGGVGDFEGAFTAAKKRQAQAVVVLSSPLLSRYGARLAELSIRSGLPTVSLFKWHPTAGCLMSYGPVLEAEWPRLASFVDRVFRGAPPGDLPVERPARFELVINLKTAKALGLTIPPSLMARADQVIE